MTEANQLSLKECQDFLACPNVNPLTGRKLTSDAPGGTKWKLTKYCNAMLRDSQQAIAKKSICKAPWMGPVIHPEYKDSEKYARSHDERYALQIKEWCEHLRTRMPVIRGSESYSKMELDDLIKSLNYIIKAAFTSSYVPEARKYVAELKRLLKTDKVVDDYQEFESLNWFSFDLKKDRFHLRKFVGLIHARISEAIHGMKKHIEKPGKEKFGFDELDLKLYLRDAEFLDLLIDKCYFREEDIFGRLFPEGRQVFKILKDTYKKYAKL